MSTIELIKDFSKFYLKSVYKFHLYNNFIAGTLIAAHFIEDDWSLSFLLPGALTGLVGFIIFLFLVDHPAKVQIVIDAKVTYNNCIKKTLFWIL